MVRLRRRTIKDASPSWLEQRLRRHYQMDANEGSLATRFAPAIKSLRTHRRLRQHDRHSAAYGSGLSRRAKSKPRPLPARTLNLNFIKAGYALRRIASRRLLYIEENVKATWRPPLLAAGQSAPITTLPIPMRQECKVQRAGLRYRYSTPSVRRCRQQLDLTPTNAYKTDPTPFGGIISPLTASWMLNRAQAIIASSSK